MQIAPISASQIEQDFANINSIIIAHTNAAIAKVNAELLQTYWEVGEYVSARIKSTNWGDHVVSELADYLKQMNPKRRGYSKRNIYNMVRFYEVYSTDSFTDIVGQLQLSQFVQMQTAQISARPIMQTPSAQLESSSIPAILCLTTFSNHIEIINRCSGFEERIFYILYSAQQHLKYEELRRCITSQTFSSIMSKEKMMSSVLASDYPGAEYMLKDGINKETVRLFDCMGRCLQTVLAAEGCTIEAPAAGVYLLQIGNNAAQKVVVLK